MGILGGGASQGGSGFSSLAGRLGGGASGRPKMTALLVGGAIALVVLVLIFIFIALRPGGVKSPLSILRKPSVPELKKAYQNPFEKETQYVNPFAEFKSPFQSLQQ